MPNKNEWMLEQEYLSMVYRKLLETQKKVFDESANADEDSRSFMKNLSDDIKMNTSSASDSFESLIEIEAKNQQLAQMNFKREWLEKQKNNIHHLLESPYFAKLDVLYPEEKEAESFYIGVAGFSDEEHTQYVYDWRSPIANLYYENNIGKTSYQAPMGKVEVDLKKRRQMKVEKDKLIDFFDTATAIEDPMLLQVLNEESTAKLQDITSTIQREQNEIIRDTTSDVLIVEGIAGSGKTSTILQRIAFLLYRYRDDLQPEQVLLLSPNPMFSKYIEEVLPSLGEKNPRQMTYRDLMRTRGRHYDVETLEAQLKNDDESESIETMYQIEAYVSGLEATDLILKPIRREEEVVISEQWMREKITALPSSIEMHRKLDYLKDQMTEYLNQHIQEESKKQKWRNELQNLSNEEYNQLFPKGAKGKEEDNVQKIVYKLVSRAYSKLRARINNFSWLDMESHYYLATGRKLKQSISLNQATELAYLSHLMVERRNDRKIKFIIIDEVQDYSDTQLYFISQLFGHSNFTLVGDGYQSIFTQGTTFQRVEELFTDAERKVKNMKLLKSYRSSGPISHFMKKLAGGEHSGIEVIDRPGREPEIKGFESKDDYLAYVKKLVLSEKKGYRKVILTKNSQDARALYQDLNEEEISLISDSTKMRFDKKVMIMPVYLAKGLEFDVVIIHDASQERFSTKRDLNILYTASSRAMHELYVPYFGNPSHFITE